MDFFRKFDVFWLDPYHDWKVFDNIFYNLKILNNKLFLIRIFKNKYKEYRV